MPSSSKRKTSDAVNPGDRLVKAYGKGGVIEKETIVEPGKKKWS